MHGHSVQAFIMDGYHHVNISCCSSTGPPMSIINDLNIDAIQNITKKATLTVITVGLPVYNPMIYTGVFGVHVRSF